MDNLIFYLDVTIISKCFTWLISFNYNNNLIIGTIIITFILQTRKLKDTKVKWIVHSYINNKVV